MARRDGSVTPLRRFLIALIVLAVAYGLNWIRQRPQAPDRGPDTIPSAPTRPESGTGASLPGTPGTPSLPGAPGPPARQAGVAAIGCFNIEWFGSGNTKPRTEEDIRAVADVIKATDAALLGLAEIGDEQTMDRLLQYLPGYQYALGTSGRGQRCGILWDTARASVGRPFEWPDINQGLERSAGTLRAPLYAQARVGNFDFLFVVVHLKAMFDDRSIRMRRTQAARLRARLDEWLAENADKDVIVVGDYNDLPDSPTLRAITGGRGFVNAGARLPDSATTYLGRSSRIDHVLIASPAVSQEEWTSKVFIYPKPRGAARTAYEDSVSDHLPTWATFDTREDNDP